MLETKTAFGEVVKYTMNKAIDWMAAMVAERPDLMTRMGKSEVKWTKATKHGQTRRQKGSDLSVSMKLVCALVNKNSRPVAGRWETRVSLE